MNLDRRVILEEEALPAKKGLTCLWTFLRDLVVGAARRIARARGGYRRTPLEEAAYSLTKDFLAAQHGLKK